MPDMQGWEPSMSSTPQFITRACDVPHTIDSHDGLQDDLQPDFGVGQDAAPVSVTRGHDLQSAHASGPHPFLDAPLIDWLAFTVPCDGESPVAIADNIARYFAGNLPKPAGFGRFGYADHYPVLSSGAVYFHAEKPEMHVHVELPSSALGHHAMASGDTPLELIAYVVALGGTVTRLDIAADSDQITMDQIMAAYHSGQMVTKIQKHVLMEDLNAGGKTLYLGSTRNGTRRRVRFYDKAAQQDVPGIWTRCEVQLRREQADQAAMMLMAASWEIEDADVAQQEAAEICRRIIISCVDFRKSDGDDTNKTRWQRVDWWADWLGNCGKLSFVATRVVAHVERTLEWVKRQVAPSLAMLVKAAGGDTAGWLSTIIDDGWPRMRRDQRDAAEMFCLMGESLSCV